MDSQPDSRYLVQILESGVNVVTTTYMLAGAVYSEEATSAMRAAAQRGCAFLNSRGIYPGRAPMVRLPPARLPADRPSVGFSGRR